MTSAKTQDAPARTHFVDRDVVEVARATLENLPPSKQGPVRKATALQELRPLLEKAVQLGYSYPELSDLLKKDGLEVSASALRAVVGPLTRVRGRRAGAEQSEPSAAEPTQSAPAAAGQRASAKAAAGTPDTDDGAAAFQDHELRDLKQSELPEAELGRRFDEVREGAGYVSDPQPQKQHQPLSRVRARPSASTAPSPSPYHAMAAGHEGTGLPDRDAPSY